LPLLLCWTIVSEPLSCRKAFTEATWVATIWRIPSADQRRSVVVALRSPGMARLLMLIIAVPIAMIDNTHSAHNGLTTNERVAEGGR